MHYNSWGAGAEAETGTEKLYLMPIVRGNDLGNSKNGIFPVFFGLNGVINLLSSRRDNLSVSFTDSWAPNPVRKAIFPSLLGPTPSEKLAFSPVPRPIFVPIPASTKVLSKKLLCALQSNEERAIAAIKATTVTRIFFMVCILCYMVSAKIQYLFYITPRALTGGICQILSMLSPSYPIS